MNRRVLLILGVLASLALPGCGEPSSSSSTPPPPTPGSTPTAPRQMTVTHILVGFAGPGSARMPKPPTRSKADALRLAKSLLADVQAGRKFDDLVEKFTEDRSREGKPNTNNDKPGSYTWPTRDIPAMEPAFEKASRDTPVGKLAPEPVETAYGYHLIRRDK